MKSIQLFISFIALVFFFTSCEVGVNKDLMTGLKVSNKNLSYEEAYIVADGQRSNNSEYSLGAELVLHIDGVTGFTEENGVVFLGASMSVVDQNNVEVLHYPDLFSSYDESGVSPLDAKMISLTLTTGSPMENGNKYTWKSRVWDKKGQGEITTEMEVGLKK